MAAPLTSTASLHGPICISCMNPPPRQVLKLKSSSSQQAFQSGTHTGRLGSLKAYSPNSSSSASLGKTSVHAHLEAESSIESNDTKFQQQHQVQDFVIPRFVHPFCHTRNPLEEEANRAAQQWYHHYFANTMIPETFYKIQNASFLQTIPVCVHPTAKLSRLEWAIEFYLFLFIIDDVVQHKIHTSSLEDLEEFFLELMVVIISSFPKDHILKENLTKYFNDEIDQKSTKDFAKKVLAQVMQHSKTGMFNK
jgi:hypothetical protein